jgi:hypothetical protein
MPLIWGNSEINHTCRFTFTIDDQGLKIRMYLDFLYSTSSSEI